MRTVDPIRRGLRPIVRGEDIYYVVFLVRTVDPIRRGLRLRVTLSRLIVYEKSENR